MHKSEGCFSPFLSLRLHLQQLLVSSVAATPARLAASESSLSDNPGPWALVKLPVPLVFPSWGLGCGLVASSSTCLVSHLFHHLCEKLPALNSLCCKCLLCLCFLVNSK